MATATCGVEEGRAGADAAEGWHQAWRGGHNERQHHCELRGQQRAQSELQKGSNYTVPSFVFRPCSPPRAFRIPAVSLPKMVANVLSAIEEALSKKDLQVLKTPLCGYRTFDNFLDATPWEHLHPTMPHAVCEPPKLRVTLYAASSRSP